MKYNKDDLVYVDLRHEGSPPLCAISKFIRKVDMDGISDTYDSFYALDTQHHGIIYIDCNSSDIKLFESSLTGN